VIRIAFVSMRESEETSGTERHKSVIDKHVIEKSGALGGACGEASGVHNR